jgi:hypothetical protein
MPSARVDVLLVTQPGRVETAAAGVLVSYHALQRDMRAGVRDSPSGRVEDIAPTVLNGLGVPLSRELTGRPLLVLFFAPNGGRYVDSYGRPFSTPASAAGKPLDQETIDRLRSLGYIK